MTFVLQVFVSTPRKIIPVVQPIFTVAVAHAETSPEPISKLLTLEEVSKIIEKNSTKYHVKFNSLLQTIICESPKSDDGLFDPSGQSEFTDEAGKREESYGITEINLPSHPDITKEQATDAEWSIEWMTQQFAAGKASMWTCWRDLKASGKI